MICIIAERRYREFIMSSNFFSGTKVKTILVLVNNLSKKGESYPMFLYPDLQ